MSVTGAGSLRTFSFLAFHALVLTLAQCQLRTPSSVTDASSFRTFLSSGFLLPAHPRTLQAPKEYVGIRSTECRLGTSGDTGRCESQATSESSFWLARHQHALCPYPNAPILSSYACSVLTPLPYLLSLLLSISFAQRGLDVICLFSPHCLTLSAIHTSGLGPATLCGGHLTSKEMAGEPASANMIELSYVAARRLNRQRSWWVP